MSHTFLTASIEEGSPRLPGARRDGKFHFIAADDLIRLPSPKPLIDGMLARQSTAILYGPPGAMKSFLALHLAISVSLGRPIFARAAHPGPVLYLAAEGWAGMKRRVRAWKFHFGVKAVPDLTFLCEAVNLMDEKQTDSLAEALTDWPEPPVLVVFDTLARCLIGGEENSSRDTGIAIDALDRLNRAVGCTSFVVHHSGKKGLVERGSSAIRGGADTMMSLAPSEDDLYILRNDKQKDGEPFRRIKLRKEQVFLEEIESSCVLEPVVGRKALTERQRTVLGWLGKAGGTFADLRVQAATTELPISTFAQILGWLADERLVEKPARRGGLYTITARGQKSLKGNDRPDIKNS